MSWRTIIYVKKTHKLSQGNSTYMSRKRIVYIKQSPSYMSIKPVIYIKETNQISPVNKSNISR